MDENNIDREKEIDEITAYYEGMTEQTEEDAAKTDAEAAPKKNEDLPTAGKENASDLNNRKNGIDETKKKRLISAVSAIFIVIIGFIIGRFVLPVPDNQITEWKNTLENKDKKYLAVLKSGEELESEIEKLIKEGDEIESVFNDVVEYQKTYDKLKAENDEKQKALDSLSSELKALNDNYSGLKSEINAIYNKEYTLSPGIYTVGIDIPEGNYAVIGKGTMAVAANNVSKINVSLDGEEYPCTLSEGDMIKLSAKAKFAPMGE